MKDMFEVQPEAARSFMAERARMRAARIAWLEKHENLTSYGVTVRGADGKETTFATPFQIGSRRYEGEYPDTPIAPQTHEDPQEEQRLLEGMESVLQQALQATGPSVTVLRTGDEQHAFLMGDADRSPHPAIREGESYGEYYARVSRAYEREAGAGSAGGAITVDRGLRESAGADSPRERGSDPSGAGADQPDGPMLAGDADRLQSPAAGRGSAAGDAPALSDGTGGGHAD